MVKHSRYKGAAGNVTDSAILTRWNVTGILADRTTSAAIMTGLAPFAHNVGPAVVNKSIEKISCVVAGSAIFAGVLVNCCIYRPSGSSCNIIYTSIMARNALIGDARVCKSRGVE